MAGGREGARAPLVRWRLLLAVWLVVCIALLFPVFVPGGKTLLVDTDDNMRMTTAIELLEGQSWFDHIEHRDNYPFGASLHWSRLIDASIAGLIMVIRPFAPEQAPDIAAIIWPLLTLLALMTASAALARRLAGPEGELAGLVLPAINPLVLGEFVPGRVDHHNVQMVLVLALLLATLAGRDRLMPAVLAGLLAATSLAIGMETLPYVGIAIVIFGLFWVFSPLTSARPIRGFAVALALGTGLHWLIAVAPQDYAVAACDFISITYVAATVLAGLALLSATYIGQRFASVWSRFGLMAALGAAAGGMTLALFPHCIGGPYGQIAGIFIDKQFSLLIDTQPVRTLLVNQPLVTIATLTVALAGTAIYLWRAIVEPTPRRADWLVLLAFAGIALAVTLVQMRGAKFSTLMALPAGAWFIAYCRGLYLARPRLASALPLLLSWLLFAGGLHMLLAQLQPFASAPAPSTVSNAPAQSPGVSARSVCFAPAGFAQLAALPDAVVMTPFELGPAVLRHTRHAIISAGFHRNADGMTDVIDFFQTDEAQARAIAERRKLDYVALCPLLPEITGLPYTGVDSLSRALATGKSWPWLEPLSSPDQTIQIYRVDLTKANQS